MTRFFLFLDLDLDFLFFAFCFLFFVFCIFVLCMCTVLFLCLFLCLYFSIFSFIIISLSPHIQSLTQPSSQNRVRANHPFGPSSSFSHASLVFERAPATSHRHHPPQQSPTPQSNLIPGKRKKNRRKSEPQIVTENP